MSRGGTALALVTGVVVSIIFGLGLRRLGRGEVGGEVADIAWTIGIGDERGRRGGTREARGACEIEGYGD